jgi:hypothetical protein
LFDKLSIKERFFMAKIENMVEELRRTKDGNILVELNKMGVNVHFFNEGIRWEMK